MLGMLARGQGALGGGAGRGGRVPRPGDPRPPQPEGEGDSRQLGLGPAAAPEGPAGRVQRGGGQDD